MLARLAQQTPSDTAKLHSWQHATYAKQPHAIYTYIYCMSIRVNVDSMSGLMGST